MTLLVSELITNDKLFAKLEQECGSVFDTKKTLPEMVFVNHYQKFAVMEYANFYKKEFGSLLAAIAKFCGDKSVNFMLLDPDASDYKIDNSIYGTLSFATDNLDEKYQSVMSADKNTVPLKAAFKDIANVSVFCGASGKWGAMCDRLSWELIVIALPKEFRFKDTFDLNFLNVQQLRNYIYSLYHWKAETAEKFLDSFLNNYGV